ncbi:Uncharacterised protein [Streptococcus pneumoniae]|nr:Uncharacterised protein [Streptococcus pneumoniae]
MYNSFWERSYVTTQSIKKLKQEYRDWALDKSGWRMVGAKNPIFYNLDELEHREELKKQLFFKESPFYDEDLPNQRLIVTFLLNIKTIIERYERDRLNGLVSYRASPAKLPRRDKPILRDF